MSEYKAKPNSIIDGSIIITLYFIFWVILTVLMPIIFLVLRLNQKESQICDDLNQNSLQDL